MELLLLVLGLLILLLFSFSQFYAGFGCKYFRLFDKLYIDFMMDEVRV